MRGTRADGQRSATALRRPAIQYSGGIVLLLPRPRPNTPRPNTWPLNSQRLGRFRSYCPSDPLRPAVWRLYHIPPDKLLACFGNFRRHSSARRVMAPGHVERTACESFGSGSRVSALPFVLSQQSFGYCPRAKRSRSTTRAGLIGDLFETAHEAIAPIWQPGAYIRSGELGSVVEGAEGNVVRKTKGWLEHEIRHAAETREA